MSNAMSAIRASTHWKEIAETLAPRVGSKEGVLPPLMILLTIVTGIVDAVAYLKLGHVFVANMTGNVVFLGFAAAGASGLSVAGSLLALACFLPGGVAAGRLAARSATTSSASSAPRPRFNSSSARRRSLSPLLPAMTSAPEAATR